MNIESLSIITARFGTRGGLLWREHLVTGLEGTPGDWIGANDRSHLMIAHWEREFGPVFLLERSQTNGCYTVDYLETLSRSEVKACQCFLPSLCWSMVLLGIFMSMGALVLGILAIESLGVGGSPVFLLLECQNVLTCYILPNHPEYPSHCDKMAFPQASL